MKDLRRPSFWGDIRHACQWLPHMQGRDVLVIIEQDRALRQSSPVVLFIFVLISLKAKCALLTSALVTGSSWSAFSTAEMHRNCNRARRCIGQLVVVYSHRATLTWGLNLPAECSYLYQSIWWLTRFIAGPKIGGGGLCHLHLFWICHW